MSAKNSPFAFLFRVWLVLSTVANVIALASLAEGVIAWSDFLRDMIESYQALRDLFWGNLFEFIHVDMPTWANDYFTINSIFAVSLLWAMVDASHSIRSSKLGSTLAYLTNNILDLSVGGSIPESAVGEATERLRGLELDKPEESVIALARLGRPMISVRTVLKSAVVAPLAVASYFGFAFLFPWIIQFNDAMNARLSLYEFNKRKEEVQSMSLDEAQKGIVLAAFDNRSVDFASFAAMDEVFHRTLQRSLLRYFIAVVLLFLLLVLVNQVARVVLVHT